MNQFPFQPQTEMSGGQINTSEPIDLPSLAQTHAAGTQQDVKPSWLQPLEIAILLVLSTGPLRQYPAQQVHLSDLHARGLIDREDGLAALTEKGKVYCKAIKALPLPVQKWEMPK
jgi:hypothetical protein